MPTAAQSGHWTSRLTDRVTEGREALRTAGLDRLRKKARLDAGSPVNAPQGLKPTLKMKHLRHD